MTKFKFYKDKFGVHVYYVEMNREAIAAARSNDLYLNTDTSFNYHTTAVVPPVESISAVESEEQVVGYRHVDDGSTMATSIYNVKKADLEKAVNDAQSAGDTEARIRAMVELEEFDKAWIKDEQLVENHIQYEFEVIDIEYPADDRLTPMRHYEGCEVNYFRVDMNRVARQFIYTMMEDAGLQHMECNTWRPPKDRGTWTMRGEDPDDWHIEGNKYTDEMNEVGLEPFTGDLEECRNHIRRMEVAIRAGYDRWYMHDRQPEGLTTKMMLDFLNTIERRVQWIETKVKTQRQYKEALDLIQEFRKTVTDVAKKQMEEERALAESEAVIEAEDD